MICGAQTRQSEYRCIIGGSIRPIDRPHECLLRPGHKGDHACGCLTCWGSDGVQYHLRDVAQRRV